MQVEGGNSLLSCREQVHPWPTANHVKWHSAVKETARPHPLSTQQHANNVYSDQIRFVEPHCFISVCLKVILIITRRFYRQSSVN